MTDIFAFKYNFEALYDVLAAAETSCPRNVADATLNRNSLGQKKYYDL